MNHCHICGRALDQPLDPLSTDCGGDCWGCVSEVEADLVGLPVEDYRRDPETALWHYLAQPASAGAQLEPASWPQLPIRKSFMRRVARDVPLPQLMQGRWVESEDPTSELLLDAGEVVYRGQTVAYDHKEISVDDGALVVNLLVDDPAREDTFARANITGLVITPEGTFHGWNVKFGVQFVRPQD